MDGIHLLLGDAALMVGLMRLGAPEDHEVALGLGELGVLLGVVRWFTGIQSLLLGLALLAEGATNVALDGGTIFEEVLHLPPVEREGGLERLSGIA